MKNIVILYHKNCPDGFGGAWAAWKKFGNKAEYIPIQYKMMSPRGLENKEIYLVDLCFQAEVMKKLLNISRKLIVIDHHIGRKEEIKISTGHLFDLNHSGSVLSWKYFHPGKKIPRLLRHIEDVDIWKFKISGTKELMASLATCDFDFRKWNKIADDFENAGKRKKYFDEGKAILKYQRKVISKIVAAGEGVIFDGHKAFAVNSPILESEIGHRISEDKKVIGLIWSYQNGVFKGSLRNDGKINLSELAKKFGGGGHRAAAGFTFKAKIKFPWQHKKKK